MVGVLAAESSLPNVAYKVTGFCFNRIYVNNNKPDFGEEGNRYNLLLAFGEIEGDGYVIHPDYDFNLTICDNFEIYVRSKSKINVKLFEPDKRILIMNRNKEGRIIEACLVFGKIITNDDTPFIVDYQKLLFRSKENASSVFYIRYTKTDEGFLDYMNDKKTNANINVYKYKQFYNKTLKEWTYNVRECVNEKTTKLITCV